MIHSTDFISRRLRESIPRLVTTQLSYIDLDKNVIKVATILDIGYFSPGKLKFTRLYGDVVSRL